MAAFVAVTTLLGNPVKLVGSKLELGRALHLYIGYAVVFATLVVVPAMPVGLVCYLGLRQFGALTLTNLSIAGAMVGLVMTGLLAYIFLGPDESTLRSWRALAAYGGLFAQGLISGWAWARVMAAVMTGGDPKLRRLRPHPLPQTKRWGTSVWWLVLAPYAGSALFVLLACVSRPTLAIAAFTNPFMGLFLIPGTIAIVLSAWPLLPVSVLAAVFRSRSLAIFLYIVLLLGVLPPLILRQLEFVRRSFICIGSVLGECSDDQWAYLQTPVWDHAFKETDAVVCAFAVATIVAFPMIMSLFHAIPNQEPTAS